MGRTPQPASAETALPSLLKHPKLAQFRSRWRAEQLAHDTGRLDRDENLLLFGPNGVGKTHLAAGICRSLIGLDLAARCRSRAARARSRSPA